MHTSDASLPHRRQRSFAVDAMVESFWLRASAYIVDHGNYPANLILHPCAARGKTPSSEASVALDTVDLLRKLIRSEMKTCFTSQSSISNLFGLA